MRLLPLLLSLRFVPGLRGFVGFSGYFEVQGAFQRAPWFFGRGLERGPSSWQKACVIRTGTRGVALGLRVPARVAALKAASSTVVFVVVAGAVVANG